jgi:hypothetical protein
MKQEIIQQQQSVKNWITFFMVSLLLSGVTAIQPHFFLQPFIGFLNEHSNISLFSFVLWVNEGLVYTVANYPFMFYGLDWLAFAHIILTVLFIGPYKDPVKNKWVIQFGMIACLLVIPFALVAGYIREMPFLWRLIDCSFGIVGLIPLYILIKKINRLEKLTSIN